MVGRASSSFGNRDRISNVECRMSNVEGRKGKGRNGEGRGGSSAACCSGRTRSEQFPFLPYAFLRHSTFDILTPVLPQIAAGAEPPPVSLFLLLVSFSSSPCLPVSPLAHFCGLLVSRLPFPGLCCLKSAATTRIESAKRRRKGLGVRSPGFCSSVTTRLFLAAAGLLACLGSLINPDV